MPNQRKTSKPVLSLFSGAGGLDHGFAQAGFETVLAIDRDRAATATFNANFGRDIARNEDLAAVSPATVVKWLKDQSASRSFRTICSGE